MQGFGIHSSIWTMRWTREAAEHAVAEAVRHGFDFVEVALLDPPIVDAAHSRALFDKAGIAAVCSLGLPEAAWPSRDPEAGIAFLKVALDKTAEMGALALSGVVYGGSGNGPACRRRRRSCPTSPAVWRRRRGMPRGWASGWG